MHAAAQTSRETSRRDAQTKRESGQTDIKTEKLSNAGEETAIASEVAPPVPPCTNEQIRAALANTLASPEFRSAPQLKSFLEFVVRASLDDQPDKIKGYTIAVEALGRAEDFNPVTDPIVRVEAARLRRRLAKYYSGSGASDLVRITIPKGSYAPVFNFISPGHTAETDPGRPGAGAPDSHYEESGHGFEDLLSSDREDRKPVSSDRNLDALEVSSAFPQGGAYQPASSPQISESRQSATVLLPASTHLPLFRKRVSLVFATALAMACFIAGFLAGSL